MSRLILSAQNIDVYEGDGLDPVARTGATTAQQVHRAGATGVILGHSEVGDAPDILQKKLLTIMNNNDSKFLPHITLLVGESWEEFQQYTHTEVGEIVSARAVSVLKDIPQNRISEMVVGYEPKWGSRGSGHDEVEPPSPELVSIVSRKLREVLPSSLPIIYGGRSTPQRTTAILADENIEGLILGSACDSVAKTLSIAEAMSASRPGKRKILHANFKAFTLRDSYEQYVEALRLLDDTFTIYLSPCHADLRAVAPLL